MNEPRKTVTIYLVTNDERVSRRLTLPLGHLKLTLFLTGVFVFALLAASVDYFGLLSQSIENKKLKTENVNLQRQFQVVEGKLESLQSALERVALVSNKLKLITDTKMKDRADRLSFPAKVNLSGDESASGSARLSEAELLTKDPFTRVETPINTLKDEVAIEKSSANYASLVIKIDEAVKDSVLKEQTVAELWESLADSQSLLTSTPSIKPTRGPVGSGFGFRIDPINGKQKMHAGLDIEGPTGTPVRAPADGVVSFVGWDDFYGKLVSIDHGYGVLTRFAHNSQVYVQVGQKVSRYDVISAIGSTGRSTGPHLHYEVRVNDVPVNPANYILE